MHLYVGGSLEAEADGAPVALDVQTNYPWEGDVAVKVKTAGRFALKLRVPGWCRGGTVKLNGERLIPEVADGYLTLDRDWAAGDLVELCFDMPVQLVRANPRVYEDAGKVAVTRGPLVYCLEEADNTRNLHLARLDGVGPEDFTAQWKPDKLGGIVELESPGIIETDAGWGEELYSPVKSIEKWPATLTWIPYYSWANRAPGEMRVWVRI